MENSVKSPKKKRITQKWNDFFIFLIQEIPKEEIKEIIATYFPYFFVCLHFFFPPLLHKPHRHPQLEDDCGTKIKSEENRSLATLRFVLVFFSLVPQYVKDIKRKSTSRKQHKTRRIKKKAVRESKLVTNMNTYFSSF